MGAEVSDLKVKPRPPVLTGHTHKLQTACGNMYITVNLEAGQPFEVFAQIGRAGGCVRAQVEAITRLASSYLRIGGPLEVIVTQLSGIRCPEPRRDKDGEVLSCSDAISRILKQYLKES